MKKELLIIADYSHDEPMTLAELCEACHVPEDFVMALIENDILSLSHRKVEQQIFTVQHIQRVQKARRLQRDLEVNLPGIALILDLLDELDEMQERLNLLEKHF